MPATSAPSTGSPSWVALRSMHDEVAVGGGPVDVDEGREALAQRLHLLLDVLVGDLDVLDLRLDAVVGGDRELGLDVDLGGELQHVVVVELGDLDLGLRERLERVLLQRLDVRLRQQLVDRLVEDGRAADLPVDHGRRDLAAAEAGDVDLLGDRLVRRVEARLELLEGHLDGQLGPGRAQGLDGALHRCVSLRFWCLGGQVRSVGATGLEPAVSCSQSRRASHYATPRQGVGSPPSGEPAGPLERMTGIEPA